MVVNINSSHPYEDDEFTLSKKIDEFFLTYPLKLVKDQIRKFYKLSKEARNQENDTLDVFFCEDLISVLETVSKRQSVPFCFPLVEPPFVEQTLVCLEGVVNLIKQAIPVGTIYNLSKSNKVLDLIIVLEKSCTKAYSEFESVIDLAMLGHQPGTCTVHNYGLLNTQIQSGHLFYHTACIEENIIYQKSTAESFGFADADVIKSAELDLKISFEKGMAKAINFYDGAQYYVKDGINDMAIFMLQQACELTYRSLLQALRGRDVKCHSPAVLRKHLKRFAPSMMGLFAENEDDELSYLQVLEEAYVKSRYHQNYAIDGDLLLFLNEKVGLLQEKANQLFGEKMKLLASYILSRETKQVVS